MTRRPAQQKRTYRMGARAVAIEHTVGRIHAAAIRLFRSRPFQEVTLQAIASASGVTLQTVLRRFGSKENLFVSAARAQTDRIFESRAVRTPSDTAQIIATLVASYEDMGDLNWSGVSQEDSFPLVKKVFDEARARHRQWVETCFADAIAPVRGSQREHVVLLLFAATDFYLWKLYRRDLRRSRAFTAARMTDMVNALLHQYGRQR